MFKNKIKMLNISELALKLGLINLKNKKPLTHTLRFWETKFKQLKPKILAGRRRYYSPKDVEMVKILLDDHGLLLKQMRSTVKTADEGGDEGTIDLLGAYIRELEKTSWMLDSWRMNKTSNHKKS